MGVPSFYRWLIEKYPKITQKFFLTPPSNNDNNNNTNINNHIGDIHSWNNELPNQIFKCDNLYIDMNGIIHNSTHVKASSKSDFENQMKDCLFQNLDRIVFAAGPQKLIYLALGIYYFIFY